MKRNSAHNDGCQSRAMAHGSSCGRHDKLPNGVTLFSTPSDWPLQGTGQEKKR